MFLALLIASSLVVSTVVRADGASDSSPSTGSDHVPIEGAPGAPLRPGFVLVEAFDEGGAMLAREALKVRRPPGYVQALDALKMLAEYGALNYSFIKLPQTEEAGAYADEPVIMAINGVKASVPRTVWVMSTTREPPGGGPPSTIENALPSKTVLLPGDVCTWRLTSFDEIPGLPSDMVEAVRNTLRKQDESAKEEGEVIEL